MDRRSFLQTLAGGLAATAATLPAAAAVAAPPPPSRGRFVPSGAPEQQRWSAVVLGVAGLRRDQRAFRIGEALGDGWWEVKRLTPRAGCLVLVEPGQLYLWYRQAHQGCLIREQALDLEG